MRGICWVVLPLVVAACNGTGREGDPYAAQNADASGCTPGSTVLTPTSGGSVSDASGNTWTLTAGGNVQMNGQDVAGGGGTSALTYAGGLIYGQDAASGGWYAYQNNQWNGPQASPVVTATCPQQPTVLTRSSGGSLTDAKGNTWTLTSDGRVQENGQDVAGGGGTSELTYVNGVIYGQDAASRTWYAFQNGQWNGPQPDPTNGTTPPPSNPPPSNPPPSNPPPQTAGTRNWYENPGQDGTFWVQPFQTTAQWDSTSGTAQQLRNGGFGSPTGHVHLKGDYSVPWVIGRAGDPLVTVTDGTKSIQVHIPEGTIIEEPTSQWDQSIGGADVTQPYLVWTISGANIDTGSVRDGSVIYGTYGFDIDDGAGPIMTDQVTGQPGTNNSIGGIQDLELTLARNDDNYVIQHMLAYSLDPSQVNNQVQWPLLVADMSFPNTGGVPQGQTVGIPANVPRPQGKSRGFYLLFDNLQQFGWFYYNVAGNNCLSIFAYSTDSANQALAQDVANSINDVMQYVAVLTNQNGPDSLKGYAPGGQNAFPAPPPLDLSPTGGHNVAPSSFGAWYPSGYNVTP